MIDSVESTNSIARCSHIRYSTMPGDHAGPASRNDINNHSRGKNFSMINLLLIYLTLLLYCCFVMHLDCLNYRLYCVSLPIVLRNGKFMILFFLVYRHVTSYFIRRSRAQANLDIDVQRPFTDMEKVPYFYRTLDPCTAFPRTLIYKY